MPIIRQRPEEEDESQLRPTLGGQAAPTQRAPAGQPGPTGPTSAPGGNHINLVDYVKANQGAAQQMANTLLNPLEQTAAGAQNALNSPGRQVTTMGTPTTVGKQAAGGRTALGTASGKPAQIGPGSIAVAGAGAKVDQLGTPGGQQNLLDKQYGPRSGGESALDNALLGSAAGNRMNDLRTKYQGLHDLVRGQETGRDAAAADYARRVEIQQGRDDRTGTMERDSGSVRNVGVWGGPRDQAPGRMEDLTHGKGTTQSPDNMTDQELNAMGYMYQQAPGESYAHYSDRVAGRTK